MVLNEFKTQQITWDKATKQFHEKIEANSGDTNGRKLKVQIINNSLIEDLTGVTLNLAWRTKDNSNFGLDVFEVIDATKGIFEIIYTTEMLSNLKKLKASLVMIDSTGRTESNEFNIDVKPSVVNDGAVQSQNSFTALTSALVKVNEWNGRIDAVEQDYADRAEALEQTYAPKLTNVTEQLAQTAQGKHYPTITEHPFANNPVLTKDSVVDRTAMGVADPFICKDDMYHMFFEVISSGREEIGHAYSHDGLKWHYTQIVLTELNQHFAYPYVVKHKGKWYMIPDKTNVVDIYEATNFPYEWEKTKTMLSHGSDATPFFFQDTWYMHVKQGNFVELYYNEGDLLDDNWIKHPKSPILSKSTDRGAGRPIIANDVVILPMQGFVNAYGDFAQWYTLTNLSKTTLNISEGTKFMGTQAFNWYTSGMHHVDHISGSTLELLVVDGINRNAGVNNWSIGVYTKATSLNVKTKVTMAGGGQKITVPNQYTRLNMGGVGNIIYDTMKCWNRNTNEFVVGYSGFYRIRLQVATQNTVGIRNERIAVRNTTTDEILTEKAMQVESSGQATINSHSTETLVWLKAGDRVASEAYSTVAIDIMPGSHRSFFEIEKVQ